MVEKTYVKKVDGSKVEVRLKYLTKDDIPQMIHLQEEIINGIEDTSIYVAFTEEELHHYFEIEHGLIGYVTSEDVLISLAIYLKKGDHPSNYGYDLELSMEEVLQVGHVDTVLVDSKYRGNQLQYKMCQALEDIALAKHTPIMCATASPDNLFSVNNFLKLGYEIKKDKLKYGGLRRYVLMKRLDV